MRKQAWSHPLLRRFDQLITGLRGAKALFVAVELGVFQALEETNGDLGSLAKRVKASGDRLEVVLTALVALGFIKKTRSGKFLNTKFSRDWFTPGGVFSLTDNIRCQEFVSNGYADFLETVRRGRPRSDLGDLLREKPKFVRHYINGMSEIAGVASRGLAELVDVCFARNMLDVGGGPGLFSLAFLQKNSDLKAVVLDLPETLVYTRRNAARSPVGKRVSFQAGDYRSDDFGRNCYDLVLMSHVTHDESARTNRLLIRKAYRALRPGGRLIVHDFMVNKEKTGPLFPALFSIHLATFTESGRIFSDAEYIDWIKEAGFSVSRPITLLPERPNFTRVIIGNKLLKVPD